MVCWFKGRFVTPNEALRPPHCSVTGMGRKEGEPMLCGEAEEF